MRNSINFWTQILTGPPLKIGRKAFLKREWYRRLEEDKKEARRQQNLKWKLLHQDRLRLYEKKYKQNNAEKVKAFRNAGARRRYHEKKSRSECTSTNE